MEGPDLAAQSLKNLEIEEYKPKKKSIWNEFVKKSKNGVFLFNRNYMDYHSDRFKDNSLMFYCDGELVAIMPANIKEKTLYSHGGLTFGGMITSYKVKTALMLKLFELLMSYMSLHEINTLVYKAIPYIYHTAPSDEDLYALFRFGAKLFRRDVSSSIYLPEVPYPLTELPYNRKRMIVKAKKHGLIVKKSDDLKTFMEILSEVLNERHGVKPVHAYEEIKLLADRFPENIKLFAAFKANEMLAGTIIYESKNVAHAQYIANSNSGRKVGALDLVFEFLINHYKGKKRYFDFGISTEKNGQYLNEGLIWWKESFGARAVTYDFYELKIG